MYYGSSVQPSCTSPPTPLRRNIGFYTPAGAGSTGLSELGGDAGRDVGAADVAARRPDVVLLVEVVGVLDRDLLVVVPGADALSVDGPDHGVDVFLPVQHLPAAHPEVVVEVEELRLLRDHVLDGGVHVAAQLGVELGAIDVEIGPCRVRADKGGGWRRRRSEGGQGKGCGARHRYGSRSARTTGRQEGKEGEHGQAARREQVHRPGSPCGPSLSGETPAGRAGHLIAHPLVRSGPRASAGWPPPTRVDGRWTRA